MKPNSVRAAVAATLIAALGTVSSFAIAQGAAPAAAPAAATAPPVATYAVPAKAPAYIKSAVESPSRSAEQTARDANRKPAELLMLSGVKPGDKVVEFASAGQYFTGMLSDIVGAKGQVYMYDLPYTEARFGAASRAFATAHPNTKFEIVDFNTLELPKDVDVVFNVLYYHDLPLNSIDTASLNGRILKALKPGGIFFIVDHNAEAGSGTRDTKALHRIDPTVIKKEVTAAGFELVEESKLLAHPEDDHTKMVFTPGTRGVTDQTIFKFRKPKK
jgi:predicted methyltransferase